MGIATTAGSLLAAAAAVGGGDVVAVAAFRVPARDYLCALLLHWDRMAARMAFAGFLPSPWRVADLMLHAEESRTQVRPRPSVQSQSQILIPDRCWVRSCFDAVDSVG